MVNHLLHHFDTLCFKHTKRIKTIDHTLSGCHKYFCYVLMWYNSWQLPSVDNRQMIHRSCAILKENVILSKTVMMMMKIGHLHWLGSSFRNFRTTRHYPVSTVKYVNWNQFICSFQSLRWQAPHEHGLFFHWVRQPKYINNIQLVCVEISCIIFTTSNAVDMKYVRCPCKLNDWNILTYSIL